MVAEDNIVPFPYARSRKPLTQRLEALAREAAARIADDPLVLDAPAVTIEIDGIFYVTAEKHAKQ